MFGNILLGGGSFVAAALVTGKVTNLIGKTKEYQLLQADILSEAIENDRLSKLVAARNEEQLRKVQAKE